MAVHTQTDSRRYLLHRRRPDAAEENQPKVGSKEFSSLRLGAALALIGAALEVPLAIMHPHAAPPNDSTAAFDEYSHSHDWVPVHLGQFAGALLIALGLVTLAAFLSQHGGLAGALARVSAVTAVVTAAVFAVQMAVDGIALKATVDTWASAPTDSRKASAFYAAEAVRSMEKGLSALFHVNNGVTLLVLGAAIVTGGRLWRWLGWVGMGTGALFLIEAVVTAETGFSDLAATVGLGPTLLLPLFLVALTICSWRHPTGVTAEPEG